MRVANTSTCEASASSISATNSSPPRRETTSLILNTSRSTSAVSINARSPSSCPRPSLMLHAVEIDEEEQRLSTFALGEAQLLPRELEKAATIVQAREFVANRLAADGLGAFLGRFARPLTLHHATELRADVGHRRQ